MKRQVNCTLVFADGKQVPKGTPIHTELVIETDPGGPSYGGRVEENGRLIGDPTMGEVANARGRSLFAGLAVGRRFIGGGSSRTGVRARLGLRHAKLDTEEEAEFAAEGGAGVELSRFIGDDELNLSTGVEFRFGNAPDNLTDQFQTNFTMLRGSIFLPITSGNSLSINVGAPISGDVSPLFSVNFNWGLLLSDRPGLAR